MGAEQCEADWSEHDRIMGGDHLARPLYPLGGTGRTDGRRDPSPQWDHWYEGFTLSQRRVLLAFTREGGLRPEELAGELGCTIDEALERWARACQMARQRTEPVRDVDAGLADWAAADAQAQADAELYGPQELAARWQCSVPALWKRKERGRTPAPDMTISGVPIWTGETLRLWDEWADQ